MESNRLRKLLNLMVCYIQMIMQDPEIEILCLCQSRIPFEQQANAGQLPAILRNALLMGLKRDKYGLRLNREQNN